MPHWTKLFALICMAWLGEASAGPISSAATRGAVLDRPGPASPQEPVTTSSPILMRKRPRLPSGTRVLTLPDGEQHDWDGTRFPLALVPKRPDAQSLADLVAWIRRNRATLLDLVARNGAVLLRGFGAPADAHGFSELVQALELAPFAAGCSAAPRTEQAPGVFTANEAPPKEPIPFHHEMAQCEQPPAYIFFFCEVAPRSGGATPIVPSHQVASYIRRAHPELAAKLARLGVRYVRILPERTDAASPLGKSWTATYNASTRAEAEAAMREAGVEWEWRSGGDLKTVSKPMPAQVVDRASGRETFFNAIVAASTGWVDSRNQPDKAVIFGDGTALTAAELTALADVGNWMRASHSAVAWRAGDVLLIDNSAVLHSRQPFDPPRRILASLWGAPLLATALNTPEITTAGGEDASRSPAVLTRLLAQLRAHQPERQRADGELAGDAGGADAQRTVNSDRLPPQAPSEGPLLPDAGAISDGTFNAAETSVESAAEMSVPIESPAAVGAESRAKIAAAIDELINAVADNGEVPGHGEDDVAATKLSARPAAVQSGMGGASAHSGPSMAAAAATCAADPALELRSRDKMPVVGLGLWKIPRDSTAQTVYDAIRSGYRHFDCACDYGNEAEVGDGFRRAFADGLVTRDQLWVTTKLWNTYHAAEHVEPALRKSLSDLGLDYVDLFLMHFPLAQRFVPFETRYPPEWIFDPTAAHPTIELANVPLHVTWEAMEDTVRNGLARNIGVCNFNTALLRDLIAGAQIPPGVLQVELHPYNQQPKLLRYAQEEVRGLVAQLII